MRILIFGITGMLGHVLWLELKKAHEAFGAVRGPKERLNIYGAVYKSDAAHIIDNTDVFHEAAIDKAVDVSEPEVIINCIGIIKQVPAARDPVIAIAVNSLFPHVLAKKCSEKGIRLIHISTDCVFSGKKGGYVETDLPDAEDLYGRTKLLGEVTGPKCLTLRTSLIGRELSGANGLLEWFLSQTGKRVNGYQKAIFSGLTTYAMSKVMRELVEKHQALEGLYHVSSEPLAKYDLLHGLKRRLSLNVDLVPDQSCVVDRSLDSTRFREATGAVIPSWDEMLEELAARIRQ
ncbi:MAG: SDR family oxidoreductase [Nitrospirae bacterium]|nr:SDR family oxidoreductase [Nitrospirota bacterium]